MSPRSLRAEAILQRAERASLLGRQVLCPAKPDMFLITCTNGTRDRWDTVEKLLALAVQVRTCGRMTGRVCCRPRARPGARGG